ncbi:hypothetical protein [uncultured Microscilla sp.]|uniref:hypothetical protein n=1 Tax=uncultured Microscilla sp. TaxID=432653 RepID=UPI00260333BB|nr:hypothetical protein [uncultured Microscilla sp.]
MGRNKRYPHQILMDEESIDIDTLPDEIQRAIVIFERGDKKDAGYNPELEPLSEEIEAQIRDWMDEELEADEDCPCKNPNVHAIFVLYYGDGVEEVTRQQLKALGFDTKILNRRGRPREEVEVGDYKLKRQGKGKQEKYKVEETEPTEAE